VSGSMYTASLLAVRKQILGMIEQCSCRKTECPRENTTFVSHFCEVTSLVFWIAEERLQCKDRGAGYPSQHAKPDVPGGAGVSLEFTLPEVVP
jgi:hypothetical protein